MTSKNQFTQTMLKFRTLALTLVFAVAAFSCEDDDAPVAATPSIVDLAIATSDLSTLVTALSEFPDLVATLDGAGTFTVFAPTNAAFNALLDDLGAESLDEIPTETLRAVLEYHVIASAAVSSAQLEVGGYETVNGQDLFVTLNGGVKINGKVTVTTADVTASNGIVHIVDRVIVPADETIADIAINNEFTELVAALSRTSGRANGEDLLAAVSGAGNFTVFAPTNAAFEELYTALGVESVNEIEINTLIEVLRHHVIDSRAYSSGLTTGTVLTLSGERVSINVTNLTVTGASGGENVANLQASLLDLHATNGVVHVINKVLLPTL